MTCRLTNLTYKVGSPAKIKQLMMTKSSKIAQALFYWLQPVLCNVATVDSSGNLKIVLVPLISSWWCFELLNFYWRIKYWKGTWTCLSTKISRKTLCQANTSTIKYHPLDWDHKKGSFMSCHVSISHLKMFSRCLKTSSRAIKCLFERIL